MRKLPTTGQRPVLDVEGSHRENCASFAFRVSLFYRHRDLEQQLKNNQPAYLPVNWVACLQRRTIVSSIGTGTSSFQRPDSAQPAATAANASHS